VNIIKKTLLGSIAFILVFSQLTMQHSYAYNWGSDNPEIIKYDRFSSDTELPDTSCNIIVEFDAANFDDEMIEWLDRWRKTFPNRANICCVGYAHYLVPHRFRMVKEVPMPAGTWNVLMAYEGNAKDSANPALRSPTREEMTTAGIPENEYCTEYLDTTFVDYKWLTSKVEPTDKTYWHYAYRSADRMSYAPGCSLVSITDKSNGNAFQTPSIIKKSVIVAGSGGSSGSSITAEEIVEIVKQVLEEGGYKPNGLTRDEIENLIKQLGGGGGGGSSLALGRMNKLFRSNRKELPPPPPPVNCLIRFSTSSLVSPPVPPSDSRISRTIRTTSSSVIPEMSPVSEPVIPLPGPAIVISS